MAAAARVAITTVAICEFAWVLRSRYRQPPQAIAYSIRRLVAAPNVVVEQDAIRAGLAFLDAGGDFADGVIAHTGAALGGALFLTFDRQALQIAATLGYPAASP